ncbi:YbfB/YjiJ family MFS transporter [Roseibium aggregatum]|uniref:YbfB/YjiJ family MFS transporter n=1 Tax=Roseibium aggregatum TaxID=187304 RepID=UPI001AD8D3BC|nr:YbfB/YjiJ family MFS transporter [Roseibium aggregatum]
MPLSKASQRNPLSGSPHPPSAKTAPLRLALGGAFALAAAMGIGRFVYTPILPFMAEGIPLSAANAGLIASANFLGYLVGALAGSLGGLPGSQRSWFLSALLASAVTTIAMGLTDHLAVFLLLRFFGGVASAFVLVFASALVLEQLAMTGRAGLSALHFAGVGSGIALSAILVAVLGGNGFSWQELWFASGLTTLGLLIAITWLVPRPRKEFGSIETPDTQSGRKSGRYSGDLLRLVIAYGLFGFGYVITTTFISVITRQTPELNEAEAVVWLAVGLSAAPSIYVWNRLSGRYGPTRAFAAACLAEAVGVGLSVTADTPALIIVAAALVGGTFVAISALGLIEARRLTTGDPRQALGIMTASFGLGQVVGPWFAGLLHEMTGDFQAPSFAAAISLVVAAGLVLMRTKTVLKESPRPVVPDWDSLRAQLLSEGKADLVDAIETLRAEGGKIDAIRQLRKNGYLDGPEN